jgi:hypothetical protein
MTRTGQHRAWPVGRPHQQAAFAAVTLMLLILAASLLVSAGSDHHRPDASPTATAAVDDDLAVAVPVSGHEHRHGNDWAPSVGKRLRPAAGLTAVHVATAGSAQPGTTLSATTAFPAAFRPSGDLTLLGVLRV